MVVNNRNPESEQSKFTGVVQKEKKERKKERKREREKERKREREKERKDKTGQDMDSFSKQEQMEK